MCSHVPLSIVCLCVCQVLCISGVCVVVCACACMFMHVSLCTHEFVVVCESTLARCVRVSELVCLFGKKNLLLCGVAGKASAEESFS